MDDVQEKLDDQMAIKPNANGCESELRYLFAALAGWGGISLVIPVPPKLALESEKL